MIPEVAKERPKTKSGAAVYGPSGAGVWTAPVLDPEHDIMYVTTGDNYSDPPTSLSDALVAMRMSTGEILWSKQFTAKDAWNSSCCLPRPRELSRFRWPGFRFRVVRHPGVAPQRPARVAAGTEIGGCICGRSRPARANDVAIAHRRKRDGRRDRMGSATDRRNLYVAFSDIGFKMERKPNSNDRTYELDPSKGGGLFAFRIDNDERMWQTPPPGCGGRPQCSPAQSAAIPPLRASCGRALKTATCAPIPRRTEKSFGITTRRTSTRR